MIYFEYENSEEPYERGSAKWRIARQVAEASFLNLLEDCPLCGCDHSYAVILMQLPRPPIAYEAIGIRAACCAKYQANLEARLRNDGVTISNAARE